MHPTVSWVSQLVRIASSSCLSSNSESEWNFVVVIFRWRVSCAHQTADWTTCTRSCKNWTLTSWWKEGKKTKVCKKNKKNPTQLLEAPFLSELPLWAYVGGPNLYAMNCLSMCSAEKLISLLALRGWWQHLWPGAHHLSRPCRRGRLVFPLYKYVQATIEHNRSMFVGAFKQAVFFRSKEGWFG